MRVVEFLRSGGTLADLETRYFIKTRRHSTHPGLVLLKYNQISSPFAEELVRECRGLILDESNGWRPVARAFDKFFNHGEQLAAPVDWDTARVQEKVDGSLCVLYHYAGEWHVATTGTPDASGPVEGNRFTFAELFWRTFEAMSPKGRDFLLPADIQRVFMFELTTPYNRVVVPHTECHLTLLGVRDMETMAEEHASDWDELYPTVRNFPLQSFDDITASFEVLEPLRQEGYVVVDDAFRRVKVKHPGYVAIHHLKGEQGPTLKRMLEIVRSNEGMELLVHFPEWRIIYDKAAAKLDALVTELESDYSRISEAIGANGAQKEFALLAAKTRWSAALFQKRAGRVATVRESLAAMPLDRLAGLLDIRADAVD